MPLRAGDFESPVSADSTIRARREVYHKLSLNFGSGSLLLFVRPRDVSVEHVRREVSSRLSGADSFVTHACDGASPQVVDCDVPASPVRDAFRYLFPRAAIVSHWYALPREQSLR
jgi:hypothetical protein